MSGFDGKGSIKDKAKYVREALNDPNNKHICHYPGCTANVKPAFWGCMPHWYSLPAWARSMIWATYNPMQEIKKNPSQAYIAVVERVHIWIVATESWNTIRTMASQQREYSENLGVAYLPL